MSLVFNRFAIVEHMMARRGTGPPRLWRAGDSISICWRGLSDDGDAVSMAEVRGGGGLGRGGDRRGG